MIIQWGEIMPFILKPILLYLVAVVLLRITGRRSISQMTISQTILIISLGHIIVEPFVNKDIPKTIIAAIVFTSLLILFEVAEYYFKGFEKVLVGKEKVLISSGVINQKTMKKLRLTKNELYSLLRQKGINQISDIKKATLEPNGELGYELMKAAQPITVADLEHIINQLLDEQIDLTELLKNQE